MFPVFSPFPIAPAIRSPHVPPFLPRRSPPANDLFSYPSSPRFASMRARGRTRQCRRLYTPPGPPHPRSPLLIHPLRRSGAGLGLPHLHVLSRPSKPPHPPRSPSPSPCWTSRRRVGAPAGALTVSVRAGSASTRGRPRAHAVTYIHRADSVPPVSYVYFGFSLHTCVHSAYIGPPLPLPRILEMREGGAAPAHSAPEVFALLMCNLNGLFLGDVRHRPLLGSGKCDDRRTDELNCSEFERSPAPLTL